MRVGEVEEFGNFQKVFRIGRTGQVTNGYVENEGK